MLFCCPPSEPKPSETSSSKTPFSSNRRILLPAPQPHIVRMYRCSKNHSEKKSSPPVSTTPANNIINHNTSSAQTLALALPSYSVRFVVKFGRGNRPPPGRFAVCENITGGWFMDLPVCAAAAVVVDVVRCVCARCFSCLSELVFGTLHTA